MDELPIIPIYYYVDKNMLKKNVRGFHRNPLDQHPLSAIWIDEAPDTASPPTSNDAAQLESKN
jgi:oligopeptide transport system substrate-binding protein